MMENGDIVGGQSRKNGMNEVLLEQQNMEESEWKWITAGWEEA